MQVKLLQKLHANSHCENCNSRSRQGVDCVSSVHSVQPSGLEALKSADARLDGALCEINSFLDILTHV